MSHTECPHLCTDVNLTSGCCMSNGVQPHCLPFCSGNMTNFEDISYSVCLAEIQPILNCISGRSPHPLPSRTSSLLTFSFFPLFHTRCHLIPSLLSLSITSDGRNHLSCCQAREVPYYCLDFCTNSVPLLSVSLTRCLDYANDLIMCIEENQGGPTSLTEYAS